jgi:lipopolysaccharide export system protein LptC
VTADSLDVVDNGRVISFVGNVRTVFNGSPAAEGAAPPARILTSSAEPPDGGGRP